MHCYVMESAHTNIYIYPSSMIPDTTSSPPPSSPQLDKHVNCGYYWRAKAVSSLIASFINTQHLHFTILEFTFISNSLILLGRLSNKIGSNVKRWWDQVQLILKIEFLVHIWQICVYNPTHPWIIGNINTLTISGLFSAVLTSTRPPPATAVAWENLSNFTAKLIFNFTCLFLTI